VAFRNTYFPPNDAPNPAYGLLQPTQFESTNIIGTNPVYRLATRNGQLPGDIPNNAPVYRVIKPSFSFNAGKEAQDMALYLGFTPSELITGLNEKVYKWRKDQTSSLLSYSTLEHQVDLQTVFARNREFFAPGGLSNS